MARYRHRPQNEAGTTCQSRKNLSSAWNMPKTQKARRAPSLSSNLSDISEESDSDFKSDVVGAGARKHKWEEREYETWAREVGLQTEADDSEASPASSPEVGSKPFQIFHDNGSLHSFSQIGARSPLSELVADSEPEGPVRSGVARLLFGGTSPKHSSPSASTSPFGRSPGRNPFADFDKHVVRMNPSQFFERYALPAADPQTTPERRVASVGTSQSSFEAQSRFIEVFTRPGK